VGGTSTNASVTVGDIAFYVILPPSLEIQISGTNVILAWPLSATGWVLEMTDDVGATNSWTAVADAPTVVNLQNVVTNGVSAQNRFYRLTKQ